MRLSRYLWTTPRGRDVSAQRSRTRTSEESLGNAAISASATSRSSTGNISFFRSEFTRKRSLACSMTHLRRLTSRIIRQSAYLVRTCCNWGRDKLECISFVVTLYVTTYATSSDLNALANVATELSQGVHVIYFTIVSNYSKVAYIDINNPLSYISILYFRIDSCCSTILFECQFFVRKFNKNFIEVSFYMKQNNVCGSVNGLDLYTENTIQTHYIHFK